MRSDTQGYMPDILLEDRAQAPALPGGEETSAQVDKLLASPPFQHSDPTRKLLTFLAQRYATHPGQSVKEIELAMLVYDLSPDTFDPQLDSTVRVKVGRLRAKILDYYANYGQNDEIVLEIPKGAYCLISHYRQGTNPSLGSTVTGIAPPSDPAPALEEVFAVTKPTETKHYRSVAFSASILVVLLGILGIWMALRPNRADKVPEHLQQFWGGMSSNNQPLIAVFSNPRLAGVLAHGGLHYYQDVAGSDPNIPVNLGYAGAGDVESVHELTRLFDQLHRDLRVESGALLSWDSAKDSNLIFIGRPEQNPALDQLPRLREFYFKFNEGIVNAHPQPGETGSYHYLFRWFRLCCDRLYPRHSSATEHTRARGKYDMGKPCGC